MRIWAICR